MVQFSEIHDQNKNFLQHSSTVDFGLTRNNAAWHGGKLPLPADAMTLVFFAEQNHTLLRAPPHPQSFRHSFRSPVR